MRNEVLTAIENAEISGLSLESALSSFGRAVPTELDRAESMLYRFEKLHEGDDNPLVQAVLSGLREQVEILGLQNLQSMWSATC